MSKHTQAQGIGCPAGILALSYSLHTTVLFKVYHFVFRRVNLCVCSYYRKLKQNPRLCVYCNVFTTQKRSYRSGSTLQGITYPLVGRAVFSLPGSSRDLALITQRPMAVSSDGHALELMLHRYMYNIIAGYI